MIHLKSLTNNKLVALNGFKFSIGCAEECDISLPDSMLNDIHALLWVGTDFVTVMVVQNAVISINGKLITDRGTAKPGDKVSFADMEMEIVDAPSENTEGEPEEQENPDDWILISRNQEMKGKRFPIKEECSIGRAKDNTICVPILSLSRLHATLSIEKAGMRVTDRQSANGTFVNGKKIDTVLLNNGDVIAFDALEFLVKGPETGVFSDKTEIRNIRTPLSKKPSSGTHSQGNPTAIDRQKISIHQKPEGFTKIFKALDKDKPKKKVSLKKQDLLRRPTFWALVLVLVLVSAAAIYETGLEPLLQLFNNP